MKRSVFILGLSAYRPDSAAVLIKDGCPVAAAREAWFSNRPHDADFPKQAIAFCLDQAGITLDAVDAVAFSEKPLQTFLRTIESFYAFAPRGLAAFMKAVPEWLGSRLFVKKTIAVELERLQRGRLKARPLFASHHQSHAAAAFFPSPFDKAAVLVVDGKGEYATTSIGKGQGKHIELLREIKYPHSLGQLQEAFLYHSGLSSTDGHAAFDRLALLGEARYVDRILERLVDTKADGSFRLDMRYFNFAGPKPIGRAFAELFGHAARQPGEDIRREDRDMAASFRQVAEGLVLKMAATAHELTGCRRLVFGGDMAGHPALNRRLALESPFDELWIQPAFGDDGAAMGAALAGWHGFYGKERDMDCSHGVMMDGGAGPGFDDREIERRLATKQAVGRHIHGQDELLQEVADELAQGRVLGWYQGPMRLGGGLSAARAILVDPRHAGARDRLQGMLAASATPVLAVVAESAGDMIDLSCASPYGLLQAHPSPTAATFGFEAPAPVRTVRKERHPRFHALLRCLGERHGGRAVMMAPLQEPGRVVACYPEQAFACLQDMDLDLLVAGNWILAKDEQVNRDQASG